jgi:methyl-accepting chemotaxis protein
MKRTTFWKGATPNQAVVLLLLTAGFILVWWRGGVQTTTTGRSTQLIDARDRIYADVLEINDALQGLVIDPRNELERKRGHDAENDLSAAIDSIQAAFANHEVLISAVKNLHSLYGHTLEQMDADAPGAVVNFRKSYAYLQQQREQMLASLNLEIRKLLEAENTRALSSDALARGSLLAILLLCLLLVASQSAAIRKPLAQLSEIVDQMRNGDLAQRAPVDGPEPFSRLGAGVNQLAEDLSSVVAQVRRSGAQMTTVADRIASTAQEQEAAARELATATAGVGTASRDISAASKDLLKTIDEVSHAADDTSRLVNSGQSAIAGMESVLRQILEASGAITAKLAVLNEKTANINSVVTTFTKVADQTNLLSLNAAIEAEKAGEYGLGFAVVAVEIRRLADQTAVATYDIEKTVREMQTAVAAGVMGMDKFSEEARHGVEDVRSDAGRLGQILHQVESLTSRFQIVNRGMHAQAAGTHQLGDTLGQLSESARQTAEALRQSNTAIGQVNETAQALQDSMARFKIGT